MKNHCVYLHFAIEVLRVPSGGSGVALKVPVGGSGKALGLLWEAPGDL